MKLDALSSYRGGSVYIYIPSNIWVKVLALTRTNLRGKTLMEILLSYSLNNHKRPISLGV